MPAISTSKGGNGHLDATHDAAQIEEWAANYPNANVGVCTGEPSGIMVIDVDPRNDGDKTLAALEAEHGRLPDTVVARTGNGGRHILFKHVPGLKSGNNKLGSGVDLKAEGGYVVGVGSIIDPSKDGPGGEYIWEAGSSPSEVAVAEAPPWMQDRLRPKHAVSPAPGPAPAIDSDDTTLAELDDALGVIPADDRDTWRRVGQALYHDRGEVGRAVWDHWSAKSAKYDAKDQDRVWRSFASSQETRLASIFALAREYGADPAEIARKHCRNGQAATNRGHISPPHGKARSTASGNGDGMPPQPRKGRSVRNIAAHIEREGIRLTHDEFTNRAMIERDGKIRPLDDGDIRRIMMDMNEVGLDPSKEFLVDALLDQARRNSFHPVRDYLNGLIWDGKPRLDNWLSTYANANDTPLNRAYGRKTLIAAVRRVRQPGAKFDTALVLIGPQGCKKSMCVQTLACEFFTDALQIGQDPKQVIELTCGAWIVELSELAGISGRDVEHVKHFLSRQTDRARLSYDRMTTDRPRQFIVIATTNEHRFLRDPTGNRRFWPADVGEIDIDALARDRDQLWAEAAHYEKLDEPLELSRELWADAAGSQAQRTVVDPWLERIETALSDRRGHVEIDKLWQFLKIEGDRQNPTTAKRLQDVMTRLGFEKKRMRRGPNGARPYVYTNDPNGGWIDVL